LIAHDAFFCQQKRLFHYELWFEIGSRHEICSNFLFCVMMAYSGMATELVEVSQVNTPFTGVWCFVETWVDGYGQNPRSPPFFQAGIWHDKSRR
jgi:hypothetical protein